MFQIRNCLANGLVAGALAWAALLHAPAAEAATETVTVVYSFCSQDGCTDGYYPYARLIDVGGTLYGTTYYGGAHGYGTVFSLNPTTGAETVLYSFCRKANCTDGYELYSGVIKVGGALYGTTYGGGANGGGSVFKINLATGVEKMVYSFCSQASCADGQYPYAGLINVGGTLYGTTYDGGANSYGTVFSVEPTTGAETVVYSFCSQGGTNCTDGDYPYAGLINVGGTLYGTTYNGGANGYGTVFSVNPTTGAETVVYSFCSQKSCTDGDYPYAGLIDVGGTLYGTTYDGGANGYGTVFSVNPTTGAETVVYSFCSQEGCTDGDYPQAGLIKAGGALYGTTIFGGGSANCPNGCGTVFKVDVATGHEKRVYSFCSQASCTDGYYPYAGLINVGGTLYGTTYDGGANDDGTVFKITITR